LIYSEPGEQLLPVPEPDQLRYRELRRPILGRPVRPSLEKELDNLEVRVKHPRVLGNILLHC